MNENIFKALGTFLDSMRPYIKKVIEDNFQGEPWEGEFFRRLKSQHQSLWNQAQQQGVAPLLRIDYHNMVDFIQGFREELGKALGDKGRTYALESIIRELKVTRNKCQHFTTLTDDEVERAYSNLKTAAGMLNMPNLRQEIDRLEKEAYQQSSHGEESYNNSFNEENESQTSSASQTSPFEGGWGDSDDSPVPSWFNNVRPYYDISQGVLDESVFAANLNEVALGIGPEVYSNPVQFFEKTYVTTGLHDIVNRVVRALNGQETENRVISLQTGFGGGKTHTLITLYHVAKHGKSLLQSQSCAKLFKDAAQPQFNNAKVAVFTQDTTDVVQGRETEDGLHIYTLWGEIAYQLGGKKAYEKIRENDESLIAPAASVFKPIIEEAGTSLILIDELAAYCVGASARKVGASNLFAQTNNFMQTLTEIVSRVPKCVLIATLPSSATEVASSEIGQEVLDALQNRIVRISASVKPVDDEEIYEVVRRRLFENIIDTEVVDLVAARYKRMIHNRRTDLPAYSDRQEYTNLIKKSYPFHPELIKMLRDRWGSDHRFQRTRGVLRLLASIVQDLWNRRGSLPGTQALIQTSDVNLENNGSLTGNITQLMGSNWESVMLADVYGISSNARIIDEQDRDSAIGKYRIAEGIATTLLMASIGTKQNRGLDIKELKLCMLKPSAFNHNDIDGALNKLSQVAHYLYSSKVGNGTYWFESKANINILISQARADVKREEMESETIRRCNLVTNNVNRLKVLVNPTGDVPEQTQLTLVIFSPKYAMPDDATPTVQLKNEVSRIATTRGSGARVYRNTIFYLTCSESGLSALNSKLQDYIACQKILREYAGRLEDDQLREVKARMQEANSNVENALVKAYCFALKYRAKDDKIESYQFKNYLSTLFSQINETVIKELDGDGEEWIIGTVGRGILDSMNMLPTVGHPILVKALYEAMLRFDDKPMITGCDAIENTIVKYSRNDVFRVAFRLGEKVTKVYNDGEIQFLTEDFNDLWLYAPEDPAIKKDEVEPQPASSQGTSPSTPYPAQDDNAGNRGNGEAASEPKPTVKTFRAITISGCVPIENYTQLWTSFVNTLKNNGLEINVSFRATNNSNSPLTENSAIVKSVKESASQLGFDFKVEE